MKNSNRFVFSYLIILLVLSIAVVAFADAPVQSTGGVSKPLLQATATNTPRVQPPTPTPSNTSPATMTPTMTQTPTSTPTPTVTRTPTNTATRTLTIVPAATAIPTATLIPATDVPLATVTPLLFGVTATPTWLFAATATPTPLASSALPTTGGEAPFLWVVAGIVAIVFAFGSRYLRQSST